MPTATEETARPPEAHKLYETDFYTWALTQADLIRAGQLDRADLPNLAEEIESLGREQAAKLRSAYRLIAMHLLKLIVQPAKATESGRLTIRRKRANIVDLIEDSPGLNPRRAELFAKADARARQEAEDETGLPLGTFPATAPFTVDQVEDRSF